MKWEAYASLYRESALNAGYPQNIIEEWLDYAKNLFQKDIPIIYDQTHLGLLVGYRPEFVRKISNAPAKFYRSFKIPKKNGGTRQISEPLPSLKEIQRWILDEILLKISVSDFAKAYIPKRSIVDNARFHKNQSVVLTIDITNFFPSLKFKRVLGLYRSFGYSEDVAVMLANLCCLHGSLPQGAPTSPYLSNLLMRETDKRISKFSVKHKIRYTRYADDMTFSGDFPPGMVIKFVRSILNDIGLKINEKKIRSRKAHQRQEVTGIVVNDKLHAPRYLRKWLRQQVFYIEKFGLASHQNKINSRKGNYILHLMGIANFIIFVDPHDEEVRGYLEVLRKYVMSN